MLKQYETVKDECFAMEMILRWTFFPLTRNENEQIVLAEPRRI